MSKHTYIIVLGVVAILLMFVTLVVAAGLWMGFTWIRAQADAAPVGGPMARLAYGDGAQDAPTITGHRGPGMMWNWDGETGTRRYGGPGMMWDWAEAPSGPSEDMPCTDGYGGLGMMGDGWESMPCGQEYGTPDGESVLSLEDAQAAVERYVDRWSDVDLHVTEVMEFEHNFYAIVAEEDTGIGAMELLVDKASGAVGPEPGPNMMWNAKYGMHGGGGMGMTGGYATGEVTLSAEDAETVAQRWLDANLPGHSAGEADPFYGYYTLHFLKDGELEGMLSVHGSTGDIWYHSWHGDFVAMVGEHD
jgi:hypothetical protein